MAANPHDLMANPTPAPRTLNVMRHEPNSAVWIGDEHHEVIAFPSQWSGEEATDFAERCSLAERVATLLAASSSPTQGVSEARQALEVCRACNGAGQGEVQHQITMDMAIDAGDREMAGHSFTEVERCDECGGAGYIPDERVDALILAATAQGRADALAELPDRFRDALVGQLDHYAGKIAVRVLSQVLKAQPNSGGAVEGSGDSRT